MDRATKTRSVSPTRGVATVLVVDDDDGVREALAEVLRRDGYTVRQAVDGLDALEAICTDRPAVVLLDLEMPRMTGLEFRAKQKQLPAIATIPVIVVSSEVAPNVDADEVIAKPVSVDALLAAVRRHAGRAGAIEANSDSPVLRVH